jgi:metallophosphoesterase (TIGR00282 family)
VSAVAPRAPSILFVGDVVGGLGRRTFLALLPRLRAEHEPTFVVVNDEHDAILRPANYLAAQPGHGSCVVARDGVRLGVVNLSGNVFLQAGRPAFTEIEAVLGRLEDKVDHVLVDMHAEATSEKVAMGWYLDGRVSAVVGTHTHVPTADARVLPRGTAYITDVGMTGPRGGVIGVKREQAIESLRTHMKVRYETAEEDPWLMGVLVGLDARPLRATSISPLLVPWDGAGAGAPGSA